MLPPSPVIYQGRDLCSRTNHYTLQKSCCRLPLHGTKVQAVTEGLLMSVHATLRLSTPLIHLQLRVATLDPIVEVDCVADVRANTLPASGRKEIHFLFYIARVLPSARSTGPQHQNIGLATCKHVSAKAAHACTNVSFQAASSFQASLDTSSGKCGNCLSDQESSLACAICMPC